MYKRPPVMKGEALHAIRSSNPVFNSLADRLVRLPLSIACRLDELFNFSYLEVSSLLWHRRPHMDF